MVKEKEVMGEVGQWPKAKKDGCKEEGENGSKMVEVSVARASRKRVECGLGKLWKERKERQQSGKK